MSPEPFMPDLPAEVVLGEEAPFTQADIVQAATMQGVDEAMVPDNVRVVRRWVCDTIEKADWAMQELAEAAAAITGYDQQKKRFTDRVTGWFKQATAEPARTVEFFTDHLQRYALQQRTPKRATLLLPSGEVPTTGKKPAVCVGGAPMDEAMFIAWAKEALPPEVRELVVKTTEQAMISEIVKVVTIAKHTLTAWPFEFGCGHQSEVFAHDGEAGPAVGELLRCTSCTVEIGLPTDRPVMVLGDSYPFQALVAEYNGEAVPGLEVTPEVVNPGKPKPYRD